MSGSSSSYFTSNPIFDTLRKDGIVNSASNSITRLYENAFNNNSLFIGLVIVIIVAIIIAYVLYTYLGSKLFSKIKSVVSDTKVPVVGTKLSKFTADLAKNANGSRKSYSFWVYINDMTKYKGQYQTIAAVSADGDNEYKLASCSPYIFLDKTNNTMYIRFSKLEDDSFREITNISSIKDLHRYLKSGIVIDYVPLQRWVHIAIVCNSNAFKTTLFAYVDGDLVKSISDSEPFTLKGYENHYHNEANKTCEGGTITDDNNKTVICRGSEKSDLNNLNLNTTGYLYVGNNRDYKYGVGPGFSGLLSSFTSYNYELNQQDIYGIYNNGPVTGFLAKLGLGSYGIRNPVYKL
jgi:hypothetical protein